MNSLRPGEDVDRGRDPARPLASALRFAGALVASVLFVAITLRARIVPWPVPFGVAILTGVLLITLRKAAFGVGLIAGAVGWAGILVWIINSFHAGPP